MVLRIDNTQTDVTGVMSVPYSWLENKAVHLYLASNRWDKLEVVFSDEIPEGVLKYITTKIIEKEAILPEGELSAKCVRLLCEMYPDKAGQIRKAVMLKRGLKTVL